MGKQIAFLRAINVGGRRIKMDELAALFSGAGLEKVNTFLASGNVIFTCKDDNPSVLEEKMEGLILEHFGFESQVMIRSMEAIQAIQNYQAFPANEIEKAGAFNVAFLKHALSEDTATKIMTLENELDRFHVHGKEVYWLCAVKQSESKFSNVVLERTTGMPSTIRGIGTINKLLKKFL